uniref:DUF4157 domain-containing protein n=1 Tax=Parastrongyloides trichosuri TaxID=131310 RepID=A0A0N4ZE76_PARTI
MGRSHDRRGSGQIDLGPPVGPTTRGHDRRLGADPRPAAGPPCLPDQPRPLLPDERPRLPAVAPAPAPQVRPAGPVSRETAPALSAAERPAPPAPRLAREAPEGAPAPPAAQAADPWQVTPESQAAATARALRTSPAGCRSTELLTRAERALCDERFNERAAEAAARRPIAGSGNSERDARFAREGARELQRYEAKRRPLSGGVGVLAPQDCPGSNFGTGCAGAHLDSSMQMDSSRNVQTRRDGAPASGRPMTPGAAGPREPMRPQSEPGSVGRLFQLQGQIRGKRLHRLFAAGRQGLVALGGDALQVAQVGAGAGRDQAADDDVFLETLQHVHLAVNSRFGKHASGFLERRRRDEAAGLQRRLGDAQQDRLGDRQAAAAGFRLGVLDSGFSHFDRVAREQRRLAGVDDGDLAQHLADDDLDVL